MSSKSFGCRCIALYNLVYFTFRKHTENGLLGRVARFLAYYDEAEVLNQSLVSHWLPVTVSSDTRYVVACISSCPRNFSVLFCKVQRS